MKKIKRILAKFSSFLPALALIIGIISANSACVSMFHQPETPDGINKYRR